MDSFRCNHGARIIPGQTFTIPIVIEEPSVLDLDWNVIALPGIFSSDDIEVDFSLEFSPVESGEVTLLVPSSRLSTERRCVDIESAGTCSLRWHNEIDGWFGGSACDLYYTIELRRHDETREAKLERLRAKLESLRSDLAAKNAVISDQHAEVSRLKASYAELGTMLETSKARSKVLEQTALGMYKEMKDLMAQDQQSDAGHSHCLEAGEEVCRLAGCTEASASCDDYTGHCSESHVQLHQELERRPEAAASSSCSASSGPIDGPVNGDGSSSCNLEQDANTNDVACSSEGPAPIDAPEKPKAITCDKCDGPHETDCCPHFKNTREKHKDAWAHYGSKNPRQLGATKENFVLRGGRRVAQPGDGNCLFHSLCYGLNAGKSMGRISAGELRSQLASFIYRNPHLEIAGDSLEEWVRWDANSSPSAYASRMSRGGWGGGLEMAACSLLKKVNVHVYENALGGFKRISRFDCPGKASKTLHVLYQGGVHYDALLP